MKKFCRDVWSIAAPYWRSEERWSARGLLFIVIGLNFGQVYISVLLNLWNNKFYSSLQDYNKSAFLPLIIRFCWLAALYIAASVYQTYLTQMLQIRWRRWATGYYVNRWTEKQKYYRIQLTGTQSDNPDQRISDDIGQFIDQTLGLTVGLLANIVTLFSFLSILWSLSGALGIPLWHGHVLHVPGYMVWVALLYSVTGTAITVWLGKPLVGLNFGQQRYEADFRFSLVRFRENTESIAFYRGEEREKAEFRERFARIYANFWQIMKRQKRLTWFTQGYSQIANIFPVVVIAPRFFAKQILLGGLTQTADAFGQVQGALSFIIGSYMTIASWRATIARLRGFESSLEAADVQHRPNMQVSEKILSVGNLAVQLPNGRSILNGLSFSLAPRQWLLVKGPSGSGKSTLLRTLAGLWPYAEGDLMLPAAENSLFVPQKLYLPLGSLRGALCYPDAPLTDRDVLPVLQQCGLGHYASRLDDSDNWSQILSPGEQQRLAFARILLLKRPYAFLDEATSALDIESEAHLYGLLKTERPDLTVISVAHRATLQQWHGQELVL